MIRFHTLEPRFVVAIPQALEPGVLYVSMEYGTVVHSCCCGCGLEVITPLTPTDWNLGYDGEGVSLWPSIGNWSFPCQSHYVITRNRVIESGSWSEEEIESERRRDRYAKQRHYQFMEAEAGRTVPIRSNTGQYGLDQLSAVSPHEAGGLWPRLRKRFRSLVR